MYVARDYVAAEILFAKLTQDFPSDFGIRASYARVLLDSGNLVRACEVLAPVHELASEGSKERALADSSANLFALLTSLEGRALRVDEDSRILAMKHAILHFKRRQVKYADADGPGRLTPKFTTGGRCAKSWRSDGLSTPSALGATDGKSFIWCSSTPADCKSSR